MLSVLARRGPDRQRGWDGGFIALGQTLLATTAEARHSLQPWVHPVSQCVVVADSRLDDRERLLRELGMHDADGVGDAPLLLAAWEKWGSDCASHLLGDFAFAIWDPVRQKLYCARDALGVRPLCFANLGADFAFATEPEALLHMPWVDPRPDEARIADSFIDYLEAIDFSSTFWRDIHGLPPATWLEVDASGLRSERYWSPVSTRPEGLPTSEAGWIEGLRIHLEQAVASRMRADVRVGSMLSGGLDSSSVVAIASGQAAITDQPRLRTFSIVSSTPDCAETRAIHLALTHMTLDPLLLDPRAEPETLRAIVRRWTHLGQPSDYLMGMIDALCEKASQGGVRVLFDGIDGDALFAEDELLERLFRGGCWRQLWREVRGRSRFYGSGQAWYALRPIFSSHLLPAGLRDWLRPWRVRRDHAALIADSLIGPGYAQRVDIDARFARRRAAPPPFRAAHPQGGAHSSIGLTITAAALERYDRVASRHGIELRHPFLDRRLVEFCAWMPLSLRQRDGWPKWALRKAMAPRLPAGLAWRRGKEHLGPHFNQALFIQLEAANPSLATLSEAARERVDVGRIAEMPILARAAAFGDADWERRLFVAALQVWLNSRVG